MTPDDEITLSVDETLFLTLAGIKEHGEERLGLPNKDEEMVIRFRKDGSTTIGIETMKENK